MLRRFKAPRFLNEQAGKVVGKKLLVENQTCKFGLFTKGSVDEVTLRDLKLCTHCREVGHRSDECQEKENLRRSLNYLVRKEVRENEETTWNKEWRKHSWKLAGKCVKCGGKDHLQNTCTEKPYCCRCRSHTHDSSFSLKCPKILRALAMLKRTRWLDDFLDHEATVEDLHDYIKWNDVDAEVKIGLLPLEEEKHDCEHHRHGFMEVEEKERLRVSKRKEPLPEEQTGAEEQKTDVQVGNKVQKKSPRKKTKRLPAWALEVQA